MAGQMYEEELGLIWVYIHKNVKEQKRLRRRSIPVTRCRKVGQFRTIHAQSLRVRSKLFEIEIRIKLFSREV